MAANGPLFHLYAGADCPYLAHRAKKGAGVHTAPPGPCPVNTISVSYTHLDVYKRQLYAKALRQDLYGPERRGEIAGRIGQKADEIESFVSQLVTASSENLLQLEVRSGEFYLRQLVGALTAYYPDTVSYTHLARLGEIAQGGHGNGQQNG